MTSGCKGIAKVLQRYCKGISKICYRLHILIYFDPSYLAFNSVIQSVDTEENVLCMHKITFLMHRNSYKSFIKVLF